MLPSNSIRSAFLTSSPPSCFCWAKFKSFLSTSPLCVFPFLYVCLMSNPLFFFLLFAKQQQTINNWFFSVFFSIQTPDSSFTHPLYIHTHSLSSCPLSMTERRKQKQYPKIPLIIRQKTEKRKHDSISIPKIQKPDLSIPMEDSYGGRTSELLP